jgi:serine/threonine-protein kinase
VIVQRFEREAQVAGTVGNDHILEILDLGALPSGERYMVMEYLDGETLTQRIKLRGRLNPKEAVSLIRQVLKGLSAAHAAGIVHRDLKPDNIFILKEKAGHRDFIKIIDFGISKFSEQGAASKMTRTGALMGTPHYMAPEQATGSAEVDRRTDIYALGIILYEAVTGRLPFQAETFNQLLFEIALAKIIPARQLVPDLDSAIDTIIMKASARDPAHRFQSSGEFIAALEEWERSGQAVSLPPDQSIEAIVAATVPRTAQTPSGINIEATLGEGALPAPRASVGGAAVPPVQPTLNSWANSQADIVPKSNTPILVATALGMLLLVGGGTAAYFIMRPAAPTPIAATSATTAPSPNDVQAPPSATTPTPTASQETATPQPTPTPGAVATTEPRAAVAPPPARPAHGVHAPPASDKSKAHAPPPPPPTNDKPKSKFNFGY